MSTAKERTASDYPKGIPVNNQWFWMFPQDAELPPQTTHECVRTSFLEMKALSLEPLPLEELFSTPDIIKRAGLAMVQLVELLPTAAAEESKYENLFQELLNYLLIPSHLKASHQMMVPDSTQKMDITLHSVYDDLPVGNIETKGKSASDQTKEYCLTQAIKYAADILKNRKNLLWQLAGCLAPASSIDAFFELGMVVRLSSSFNDKTFGYFRLFRQSFPEKDCGSNLLRVLSFFRRGTELFRNYSDTSDVSVGLTYNLVLQRENRGAEDSRSMPVDEEADGVVGCKELRGSLWVEGGKRFKIIKAPHISDGETTERALRNLREFADFMDRISQVKLDYQICGWIRIVESDINHKSNRNWLLVSYNDIRIDSYYTAGHAVAFVELMNKFLDENRKVHPMFVHGDIRLPNILPLRSGQVVLVDFDFAGKDTITKFNVDLSPQTFSFLNDDVVPKKGEPVTFDHDHACISEVAKEFLHKAEARRIVGVRRPSEDPGETSVWLDSLDVEVLRSNSAKRLFPSSLYHKRKGNCRTVFTPVEMKDWLNLAG